MKLILTVILLALNAVIFAQGAYKIGVLQYNGGGDYYANPTSVPNLVRFCNENLKTNISIDVPYVQASSTDLQQFPFIHMTGHGNVVFNAQECENLRNYMKAGGFLHIDDNFGMDEFIRRELKKVFPNNPLVELPFDHPVFNQKYKFASLPKIHEHDGKRPQAFGIIYEGRLVCMYTYETDLGDGWEDKQVHGDSAEKHKLALQMGANMLMYVFMN
jgi:hypothetical protein